MGKAGFHLNEKNDLNLRLGYNLARIQDFGKHDNEEGGGLGINVGYRHYLKEDRKGWFYEGKTSVWFMNIDWRDDIPLRTGSTYITVLQPTAVVGYAFKLSESFSLNTYAGFGYEINIISSGEDVGEGGISLLGFSLTKNF